MSVYDTSLVDDVDREADFAKILKAAADPLMEMCRQMIEMKIGSGQWEKDIFLINCSIYLQVCSWLTQVSAERNVADEGTMHTARPGSIHLHFRSTKGAAGAD